MAPAERGDTGFRPAPDVIVNNSPVRRLELPAEIVAQVVRRRAGGDLAADIGHDLMLTPLEVLDVVREVRRGERPAPADIARLAASTYPRG